MFTCRYLKQKGRILEDPQYWVKGRRELPTELPGHHCSLLLTQLICCIMQFEFNFPRRWRKRERRMYPADEALLRLKPVASSLQRNAWKGLQRLFMFPCYLFLYEIFFVTKESWPFCLTLLTISPNTYLNPISENQIFFLIGTESGSVSWIFFLN